MKLVLQFVVLITLFFSTWFGLSKIDWVEVLTIDEVSQNTEVKLGEVFWDLIRKGEKEIDNPEINSTLDSLLTKICESNQIDKFP